MAQPAAAGTYDVYSCDPGHAGGATPGWNGTHADGLTVYAACDGVAPDGLLTRSVPGPGASSRGFDGAFASFIAPSGTTVDSIHAYFYVNRPGCNWGVGLQATDGGLGGRWVYGLAPGSCGNNELPWLYLDDPINDKAVVLTTVCGASTCDRTSEARAAIRNIKLTINDPTAPSISSPQGSLW